MKKILTYSSLNTFRNCPCKYRLRYLECLRGLEKPDTLAFGSVIHRGLEVWYRLLTDPHRLMKVLDSLDAEYADRAGDEAQKQKWHLARAILTGYVRRYPSEDFEVVEIEKEFGCPIRNPETVRTSQTFTMAGKVDGIVRLGGELYVLEHKTAASLTGDYLDRLWSDTQIAMYVCYLRDLGYPVVGVLYNILLKSKIKQRAGETEEEFQARRAVLAAKNKSGKSTAKRQLPESDEDYQGRLADWYSKPEAFHREKIYLSEDRLAMVQDEVWEVTQQYLDAKRRGKWLMNTSNCFSYQRPCEYLPYCRSGFSPLIRDNQYESAAPHEELERVCEAVSGF